MLNFDPWNSKLRFQLIKLIFFEFSLTISNNFSGLLSTWSSDLNINFKNGDRSDDFDVSGDDAVGNDAQDDFDDAFDNG